MVHIKLGGIIDAYQPIQLDSWVYVETPYQNRLICQVSLKAQESRIHEHYIDVFLLRLENIYKKTCGQTPLAVISLFGATFPHTI